MAGPNYQVAEQKIYNVLLLGETGVGKSTFLNTLPNYFAYEKLAEVTDLKYFVGVRFVMMNENFLERTIMLGDDKNERQEPGKSSTKSPKMYQIILPDGNVLNIIDTPGMGDTDGLEADFRNVERTLAFISELEYLNAICILFKPNNSRLGIVFDHCIKTILGQLDQGMRKNVVFVFTNGRSSFYTPGDTHAPLKQILDGMDPERLNPVPFNQYNTFAVENDWFRYLAAKQNGATFNPDEDANFEESWVKSSTTAKRMVDYIKTLPPRRLKGMLTVNESKRLIRRLAIPIGNLLASSRKDRRQLKLKGDQLQSLLSNKELLENSLEIAVPTTVQQVSHVNTQAATSRMFVGFNVSLIPPFYTFEISPSKQTDFYEKNQKESVVLYVKAEDAHVKAQLTNNEQKVKLVEDELRVTEERIKEYQNEFQSLLTAAAQFHIFLKENVPFYSMDEIEAYIQRMIKETKDIDEDDWKMYKDVLKTYMTRKLSTYSVTINDVHETVANLLNLKHSGKQLREQLGIEGDIPAAIE